MRLCHKNLIAVLPRQQLLSQWRECCCIARHIATNGTPNHILVNKVLDYPIGDFTVYCELVMQEMNDRGYEVSFGSYSRLCDNLSIASRNACFSQEQSEKMFGGWHNNRYFWQCYYNLQEKYDCGGITEEEWSRIEESLLRNMKEE